MYEATQILLDAVQRIYALSDAVHTVDHTAGLSIESLAIEVESFLAAR